MRHIQWKGEMHIRLWWGNLWERDHLEDGGVDRMIILKWTLRKFGGRVLTKVIWLWTGISGRHL